MMDENNNYEYAYPVEELDKIIEQIDKGITPMMSDQLALEVKIRYKQLQAEAFGDDADIDAEDLKEHRELMRKHIEKKKREATKDDVMIIKLSDEQKSQLRSDMEVSIVRSNPNSSYNLPDDVLYSSEERRVIQEKLSRLKNCYYNQIDYTNAIKILREAIEYSLTHDYPWLTREEAVQQFNEGKIKFTYCNLPKLFINYATQITDPEILKGIVSGEITLKDRNEKPDNKNKNKNYNPVSFDYEVTGKTDFDRMTELHRMGYDTPISPILKTKSTIYNRYSLPTTNRFSVSTVNNGNGEPILFDWSREGAGEEYFNMLHGKKTQVTDIIRYVNSENDNLLNNIVNTNAAEFLRSMKTSTQSNNGYSRPDNLISTSLQVNEEAARIEQGILDAIRRNNPLK